MKLKNYLLKLQKIQRDTYSKLSVQIDTFKDTDDKSNECSLVVVVREYNYDLIRKQTGDYELKIFYFYPFLDKEDNDRSLKMLIGYVNEQLAKMK